MKKTLLGFTLLALSLGVAPLAFASGSGGSSGGGTTSTPVTSQVIPRVAGTWHGREQYDPTVSLLVAWAPLVRPMTALINEDALGNLTGSVTGADDITQIAAGGKATGSSIVFAQLYTAYGLRNSLSVSSTGSVVCADGSAGRTMSGKFQRKDFYGSGSGTFSLDNCPGH